MPVRDHTFPRQPVCQVGLPAPFLTPSLSPVLPLGNKARESVGLSTPQKIDKRSSL